MPIIQSVERALKILDLFDEYNTELRITEISERMQLHKSTVHSLLKTLQDQQYIDQNPDNGKYRLGLKLVERGNFLLQTIDLRAVASRFLFELVQKTEQTAHLVILDGTEGVYIDKVEGAKAAIRYSRIGRRVPLHSSAAGKVLLAFKRPEAIKQMLQNYEYIKNTKNTIDNEHDLLDELQRVRERGYAIDDEENEPGVRCCAIPIRNYAGEVTAAVSLSMLIAKSAEQQLEQWIEDLIQTGNHISRSLGYDLSK